MECWFREVTQQRIRRGSFHAVRELVTTIKQCIDNHNQNPHVFVWTASVDGIMGKISKCKEALGRTTLTGFRPSPTSMYGGLRSWM